LPARTAAAAGCRQVARQIVRPRALVGGESPITTNSTMNMPYLVSWRVNTTAEARNATGYVNKMSIDSSNLRQIIFDFFLNKPYKMWSLFARSSGG
jgi:hypothetical protein